jgi:hypothetical protein
MKKLPEVKMGGQIEGGKNHTFSSDSEEPNNFVRHIIWFGRIIILLFIGKLTAND